MNRSSGVQGSVVEQLRKGFSVLELLIALGLLGTLLALAWSILGSFRSAQQRGWDQNYRLQIAAAARELLEDDVLHWSPVVASPPDAAETACEFRGTESRFEVTMVQSLDPLPWLEQVLSGQTRNEQGLDATDLYDDRNRAESLHGDQQLSYPIPQGNIVRLRYTLRTEPAAGEQASMRLERSSQVVDLSGQLTDRGDAVASAEDRLLTAADLYRLTEDDEQLSESDRVTHQLRGLIGAKFRYHDGKQWRNRWDSTWQNGLPRAIEFSFDYRAAQNPDAITASANTFENAAVEISDDDGYSVEDILERDVRVVVFVAGGLGAAVTEDDQTMMGGL